MLNLIPAALGMLSLLICSNGYANITVQNTAERIAGRNSWEWSIYLSGSPQEINRILCVTYHLHPTFPKPNREVFDDNFDPQHAFVLSTNGWATFVVKIDVLFKDAQCPMANTHLASPRVLALRHCSQGGLDKLRPQYHPRVTTSHHLITWLR